MFTHLFVLHPIGMLLYRESFFLTAQLSTVFYLFAAFVSLSSVSDYLVYNLLG